MRKKVCLGVNLLLLLLLCSNYVKAQCNIVTNATTTVASATCSSNGIITVTGTTGGNATYYEYALYNQANTSVIKPYQTANVLDNLQSGTYTLRVRGFCNGIGYSAEYTKSVTVGGSYTTPTISVTVNRRSQCNNGRITASSSGGTNPKTYALVASQTASEPVSPGSYIRPPQTSQVFDSLAAGTYYVRVYDACGSYNTASVIVSSFTPIDPFPNGGFRVSYSMCNSLSLTVVLNNLSDYVSGTNDTLRKLWMEFPNGSIDTLPRPTTSDGTAFINIPVPLNKLGTVAATGHFPANIGGTWPKTFTAHYRDVCGQEWSYVYNLAKPNITFSFTKDISSTLNTCDSSVYMIKVNASSLFSIDINQQVTYSLDSGTTWITTTATGSGIGGIKLPAGAIVKPMVAYCGDTVGLGNVTIAGPGSLAIVVTEDARYSCIGNSGLKFYANGGTAPVKVEMVSSPGGQSWVIDSLMVIFNSSGVIPYDYLTSGMNMLPGSYVFKFTDACGNVLNKPVTINHPKTKYSANYTFLCGSNNMFVTILNDTFWNGSSSSYTSLMSYNTGSNYKLRILDANGQPVNSTTYISNSTTPRGITIPSGNINALPNGNYNLFIWQTGTDSLCTSITYPWNKTSGLISLSNSVSITGCGTTPASGTIVASAMGGSGQYTYYLYTDSISSNTLIAGPQTSNVFNGLEQDKNYILTVSDTCGRGTNTTLNFSSNGLMSVTSNTSNMPCPGDDITLSANNLQGIAYQWYKDNTALSGATLSSLSLNNLTTADNGAYKVKISAGSCITNYTVINLNVNACGTPLPLYIVNFNGVHTQEANTLSFEATNNEDVSEYMMETSTDSKNWKKLKSFAPVNNQIARYQASDKDINDYSRYYYRVKQNNKNGKADYTSIVMLQGNAKSKEYVLYPNPAGSSFIVRNLDKNATINIYDNVGKLVKTLTTSKYEQSVDINDLPSGLYLARINDGVHPGEAQKLNIIR